MQCHLTLSYLHQCKKSSQLVCPTHNQPVLLLTHWLVLAGADITETTDPTVEQEEALRKAQEEAQEAMEGEEEPEESDED